MAELGVADWLISARFRGPWLMREPATGPHELLFAMPANLFRDNQTRLWYRADPLEGDLPGWTPGRPGSRPLWRRGGPDAKRPDGFLTCQGMTRYLEGNLPEDLDTVQRSEVFEFDDRTGLEIDADTLTGVEGRLRRQFLVLKHGVGFYAEIMVPADVDGAIRGLLAKRRSFPGVARDGSRRRGCSPAGELAFCRVWRDAAPVAGQPGALRHRSWIWP